MIKINKWTIFVVISILILSLIVLEEAISTNRITAPINKLEQQKAISIAEQFLYDELSKVDQYKVFVGNTGKYFYTEEGRKKVIEVTFAYNGKSIGTLVDIKDSKVVQVSMTQSYEWMSDVY